MSKEQKIEFYQKYQQFQTSQITAETFALFLAPFVDQSDRSFSKQLKGLMGKQRKIQAIEGSKLFEDFETYVKQVKETLFENDLQRSLDKEGERYRLIQKMASLELSRKEWDKFKLGSQNSDLLELMQPHFDFYQNAEKRDSIFVKNLLEEMQSGFKTSLFVAGGFHAQGLTDRLKEKGISYALIIPSIREIPGQINYQDQMRGNVSWKDYFEVEQGKIDLHKAFVRAVRDQLLGDQAPQMQKYWRDQLLRDLSSQKRITDAPKYTFFIDELTEGLELSNQDFKAKWLANVDRFIDGLKRLESTNQLTEQKIMDLLGPATIGSGYVYGVLGSNRLNRELQGIDFAIDYVSTVQRQLRGFQLQTPVISVEPTPSTISQEPRSELRSSDSSESEKSWYYWFGLSPRTFLIGVTGLIAVIALVSNYFIGGQTPHQQLMTLDRRTEWFGMENPVKRARLVRQIEIMDAMRHFLEVKPEYSREDVIGDPYVSQIGDDYLAFIILKDKVYSFTSLDSPEINEISLRDVRSVDFSVANSGDIVKFILIGGNVKYYNLSSGRFYAQIFKDLFLENWDKYKKEIQQEVPEIKNIEDFELSIKVTDARQRKADIQLLFDSEDTPITVYYDFNQSFDFQRREWVDNSILSWQSFRIKGSDYLVQLSQIPNRRKHSRGLLEFSNKTGLELVVSFAAEKLLIRNSLFSDDLSTWPQSIQNQFQNRKPSVDAIEVGTDRQEYYDALRYLQKELKKVKANRNANPSPDTSPKLRAFENQKLEEFDQKIERALQAESEKKTNSNSLLPDSTSNFIPTTPNPLQDAIRQSFEKIQDNIENLGDEDNEPRSEIRSTRLMQDFEEEIPVFARPETSNIFSIITNSLLLFVSMISGNYFWAFFAISLITLSSYFVIQSSKEEPLFTRTHRQVLPSTQLKRALRRIQLLPFDRSQIKIQSQGIRGNYETVLFEVDQNLVRTQIPNRFLGSEDVYRAVRQLPINNFERNNFLNRIQSIARDTEDFYQKQSGGLVLAVLLGTFSVALFDSAVFFPLAIAVTVGINTILSLFYAFGSNLEERRAIGDDLVVELIRSQDRALDSGLPRSEMRGSESTKGLKLDIKPTMPVWYFLRAFGFDPETLNIETIEGDEQWGYAALPADEQVKRDALQSAMRVMVSREWLKSLHSREYEEIEVAVNEKNLSVLDRFFLLTHKEKPAAIVWGLQSGGAIVYPMLSRQNRQLFRANLEQGPFRIDDVTAEIMSKVGQVGYFKTINVLENPEYDMSPVANPEVKMDDSRLQEGISFPSIYNPGASTTRTLVTPFGDEIDLEGNHVVDIGSGNGRAAVEALLKGAAKSTALEISLLGMENTRAWAALNGVLDRIEILRDGPDVDYPQADVYMMDVPNVESPEKLNEQVIDFPHYEQARDNNIYIPEEIFRLILERVLRASKVDAVFYTRLNANPNRMNQILEGTGWEIARELSPPEKQGYLYELKRTFRSELRVFPESKPENSWRNLENWKRMREAMKDLIEGYHSGEFNTEEKVRRRSFGWISYQQQVPRFPGVLAAVRQQGFAILDAYDDLLITDSNTYQRPAILDDEARLQRSFELGTDQFWPYNVDYTLKQVLYNKTGRDPVFIHPELAPSDFLNKQKHPNTTLPIEGLFESHQAKIKKAIELLGYEPGNVIMAIGIPTRLLGFDPTKPVSFDPHQRTGKFYYVDPNRNITYFSDQLLRDLDIDNPVHMEFLRLQIEDASREHIIQNMFLSYKIPKSQEENKKRFSMEWFFLTDYLESVSYQEVIDEERRIEKRLGGYRELVEALYASDEQTITRDIYPEIVKIEDRVRDLEDELEGKRLAGRLEHDDRLLFGALTQNYNLLAFLYERMRRLADAEKAYLKQIDSLNGSQRVDPRGYLPIRHQENKIFIYAWDKDYDSAGWALEALLIAPFEEVFKDRGIHQFSFPHQLERNQRNMLFSTLTDESTLERIEDKYFKILQERQRRMGADGQALDKYFTRAEQYFKRFRQRAARVKEFREKMKSFNSLPGITVTHASEDPGGSVYVTVDEETLPDEPPSGDEWNFSGNIRFEVQFKVLTKGYKVIFGRPEILPPGHVLEEIMPKIEEALKKQFGKTRGAEEVQFETVEVADPSRVREEQRQKAKELLEEYLQFAEQNEEVWEWMAIAIDSIDKDDAESAILAFDALLGAKEETGSLRSAGFNPQDQRLFRDVVEEAKQIVESLPVIRSEVRSARKLANFSETSFPREMQTLFGFQSRRGDEQIQVLKGDVPSRLHLKSDVLAKIPMYELKLVEKILTSGGDLSVLSEEERKRVKVTGENEKYRRAITIRLQQPIPENDRTFTKIVLNGGIVPRAGPIEALPHLEANQPDKVFRINPSTERAEYERVGPSPLGSMTAQEAIRRFYAMQSLTQAGYRTDLALGYGLHLQTPTTRLAKLMNQWNLRRFDGREPVGYVLSLSTDAVDEDISVPQSKRFYKNIREKILEAYLQNQQQPLNTDQRTELRNWLSKAVFEAARALRELHKHYVHGFPHLGNIHLEQLLTLSENIAWHDFSHLQPRESVLGGQENQLRALMNDLRIFLMGIEEFGFEVVKEEYSKIYDDPERGIDSLEVHRFLKGLRFDFKRAAMGGYFQRLGAIGENHRVLSREFRQSEFLQHAAVGESSISAVVMQVFAEEFASELGIVEELDQGREQRNVLSINSYPNMLAEEILDQDRYFPFLTNEKILAHLIRRYHEDRRSRSGLSPKQDYDQVADILLRELRQIVAEERTKGIDGFQDLTQARVLVRLDSATRNSSRASSITFRSEVRSEVDFTETIEQLEEFMLKSHAYIENLFTEEDAEGNKAAIVKFSEDIWNDQLEALDTEFRSYPLVRRTDRSVESLAPPVSVSLIQGALKKMSPEDLGDKNRMLTIAKNAINSDILIYLSRLYVVDVFPLNNDSKQRLSQIDRMVKRLGEGIVDDSETLYFVATSLPSMSVEGYLDRRKNFRHLLSEERFIQHRIKSTIWNSAHVRREFHDGQTEEDLERNRFANDLDYVTVMEDVIDLVEYIKSNSESNRSDGPEMDRIFEGILFGLFMDPEAFLDEDSGVLEEIVGVQLKEMLPNFESDELIKSFRETVNGFRTELYQEFLKYSNEHGLLKLRFLNQFPNTLFYSKTFMNMLTDQFEMLTVEDFFESKLPSEQRVRIYEAFSEFSHLEGEQPFVLENEDVIKTQFDQMMELLKPSGFRQDAPHDSLKRPADRPSTEDVPDNRSEVRLSFSEMMDQIEAADRDLFAFIDQFVAEHQNDPGKGVRKLKQMLDQYQFGDHNLESLFGVLNDEEVIRGAVNRSGGSRLSYSNRLFKKVAIPNPGSNQPRSKYELNENPPDFKTFIREVFDYEIIDLLLKLSLHFESGDFDQNLQRFENFIQRKGWGQKGLMWQYIVTANPSGGQDTYYDRRDYAAKNFSSDRLREFHLSSAILNSSHLRHIVYRESKKPTQDGLPYLQSDDWFREQKINSIDYQALMRDMIYLLEEYEKVKNESVQTSVKKEVLHGLLFALVSDVEAFLRPENGRLRSILEHEQSKDHYAEPAGTLVNDYESYVRLLNLHRRDLANDLEDFRHSYEADEALRVLNTFSFDTFILMIPNLIGQNTNRPFSQFSFDDFYSIEVEDADKRKVWLRMLEQKAISSRPTQAPKIQPHAFFSLLGLITSLLSFLWSLVATPKAPVTGEQPVMVILEKNEVKQLLDATSSLLRRSEVRSSDSRGEAKYVSATRPLSKEDELQKLVEAIGPIFKTARDNKVSTLKMTVRDTPRRWGSLDFAISIDADVTHANLWDELQVVAGESEEKNRFYYYQMDFGLDQNGEIEFIKIKNPKVKEGSNYLGQAKELILLLQVIVQLYSKIPEVGLDKTRNIRLDHSVFSSELLDVWQDYFDMDDLTKFMTLGEIVDKQLQKEEEIRRAGNTHTTNFNTEEVKPESESSGTQAFELTEDQHYYEHVGFSDSIQGVADFLSVNINAASNVEQSSDEVRYLVGVVRHDPLTNNMDFVLAPQVAMARQIHRKKDSQSVMVSQETMMPINAPMLWTSLRRRFGFPSEDRGLHYLQFMINFSEDGQKLSQISIEPRSDGSLHLQEPVDQILDLAGFMHKTLAASVDNFEMVDELSYSPYDFDRFFGSYLDEEYLTEALIGSVTLGDLAEANEKRKRKLKTDEIGLDDDETSLLSLLGRVFELEGLSNQQQGMQADERSEPEVLARELLQNWLRVWEEIYDEKLAVQQKRDSIIFKNSEGKKIFELLHDPISPESRHIYIYGFEILDHDYYDKELGMMAVLALLTEYANVERIDWIAPLGHEQVPLTWVSTMQKVERSGVFEIAEGEWKDNILQAQINRSKLKAFIDNFEDSLKDFVSQKQQRAVKAQWKYQEPFPVKTYRLQHDDVIESFIRSVKQVVENLRSGKVARVASIGDLEGNYDRYRQVMNILDDMPLDQVIVMGDVDSLAIYDDYLDRVETEPDFYKLLIGNHEVAMMNAMLLDRFDGTIEDWARKLKGYRMIREAFEGTDDPLRNFNPQTDELLPHWRKVGQKLQPYTDRIRELADLYHRDPNLAFYIHAGLAVDIEGNIRMKMGSQIGMEVVDWLQGNLNQDVFNLSESSIGALMRTHPFEINFLVSGGSIGGRWFWDIMEDEEARQNFLIQLGSLWTFFAHIEQKGSTPEELLKVSNKYQGLMNPIAYQDQKGFTLMDIDGLKAYFFDDSGRLLEPVMIASRDKLIEQAESVLELLYASHGDPDAAKPGVVDDSVVTEPSEIDPIISIDDEKLLAKIRRVYQEATQGMKPQPGQEVLLGGAFAQISLERYLVGLRLAEAKPGKNVEDLGLGNGLPLYVAAALEMNGSGSDLKSYYVDKAQSAEQAMVKEGVINAGQVEFRAGDFAADSWAEADLITDYPLDQLSHQQVLQKLMDEMKVGAKFLLFGYEDKGEGQVYYQNFQALVDSGDFRVIEHPKVGLKIYERFNKRSETRSANEINTIANDNLVSAGVAYELLYADLEGAQDQIIGQMIQKVINDNPGRHAFMANVQMLDLEKKKYNVSFAPASGDKGHQHHMDVLRQHLGDVAKNWADNFNRYILHVDDEGRVSSILVEPAVSTDDQSLDDALHEAGWYVNLIHQGLLSAGIDHEAMKKINFLARRVYHDLFTDEMRKQIEMTHFGDKKMAYVREVPFVTVFEMLKERGFIESDRSEVRAVNQIQTISLKEYELFGRPPYEMIYADIEGDQDELIGQMIQKVINDNPEYRSFIANLYVYDFEAKKYNLSLAPAGPSTGHEFHMNILKDRLGARTDDWSTRFTGYTFHVSNETRQIKMAEVSPHIHVESNDREVILPIAAWHINFLYKGFLSSGFTSEVIEAITFVLRWIYREVFTDEMRTELQAGSNNEYVTWHAVVEILKAKGYIPQDRSEARQENFNELYQDDILAPLLEGEAKKVRIFYSRTDNQQGHLLVQHIDAKGEIDTKVIDWTRGKAFEAFYYLRRISGMDPETQIDPIPGIDQYRSGVTFVKKQKDHRPQDYLLAQASAAESENPYENFREVMRQTEAKGKRYFQIQFEYVPKEKVDLGATDYDVVEVSVAQEFEGKQAFRDARSNYQRWTHLNKHMDLPSFMRSLFKDRIVQVRLTPDMKSSNPARLVLDEYGDALDRIRQGKYDHIQVVQQSTYQDAIFNHLLPALEFLDNPDANSPLQTSVYFPPLSGQNTLGAEERVELLFENLKQLATFSIEQKHIEISEIQLMWIILASRLNGINRGSYAHKFFQFIFEEYGQDSEEDSRQGWHQAMSLTNMATKFLPEAIRSEVRVLEMSDLEKQKMKNLIEASYLVPFQTESYGNLTDAKGNRTFEQILEIRKEEAFPYLVKVPYSHKTNSTQGVDKLAREIMISKSTMGEMIAPFSILKDVEINGVRYPIVVVQERRYVDLPARMDQYVMHPESGQRIDQWVQVRELILESIKRGLIFHDALIARNVGLNLETGRLEFIDLMEPRVNEGDHAFKVFDENTRLYYDRQIPDGGLKYSFYKAGGDGLYLDTIGLPNDDELQKLWATKDPVPVRDLYPHPQFLAHLKSKQSHQLSDLIDQFGDYFLNYYEVNDQSQVEQLVITQVQRIGDHRLIPRRGGGWIGFYPEVNPETGERTGKIVPFNVLTDDGVWHGVGIVMLLTEDGRIGMQFRPDLKQWDLTAGGHIELTQTAATNVLEESGEELPLQELGISFNEEDLVVIRHPETGQPFFRKVEAQQIVGLEDRGRVGSNQTFEMIEAKFPIKRGLIFNHVIKVSNEQAKQIEDYFQTGSTEEVTEFKFISIDEVTKSIKQDPTQYASSARVLLEPDWSEGVIDQMKQYLAGRSEVRRQDVIEDISLKVAQNITQRVSSVALALMPQGELSLSGPLVSRAEVREAARSIADGQVEVDVLREILERAVEKAATELSQKYQLAAAGDVAYLEKIEEVMTRRRAKLINFIENLTRDRHEKITLSLTLPQMRPGVEGMDPIARTEAVEDYVSIFTQEFKSFFEARLERLILSGQVTRQMTASLRQAGFAFTTEKNLNRIKLDSQAMLPQMVAHGQSQLSNFQSIFPIGYEYDASVSPQARRSAREVQVLYGIAASLLNQVGEPEKLKSELTKALLLFDLADYDQTMVDNLVTFDANGHLTVHSVVFEALLEYETQLLTARSA